MAKARKGSAHQRAGIGGGMARAGLPAGINARRCDRVALLCTTALQAAAVLVLSTPAIAQLAPNTRPTGGQVVGGQVGISQNAQTTTVRQSSQLGAVNWQSFNVGSAHAVQFQQPNAAATTLNRVVGPDPSMIAGKITANGNVVLVNQSGVVFSKGAQVDVNGLIVTSTNISNQNFMAGRMVFDQPGSPNARIVNHGQISVKESGLAALVAPSVANHGVINARMGKVVLAGATAHTVDLYGDGLIAVDVTGQVKQAPIGPDGKAVTVLVTNTGTILADGGTVLLTAKAVDGIVNNLVTAGGKIQANTAGGKVGRIELAGVGGGLTIEGDVSAMGSMAGTKGGSVQALATGDVVVTKTARVNASGQAGGGTVAIGTTLARAAGPAVKNAPSAKSVTIERGATIAADAAVKGKGGSVVVLAAGTTRMNGEITARGGWRGGNGGFVEISGKTLASISGKVDVTAAAGGNGSILIDPDFLTIVSEAAGNGDQDGRFTGGGGTIVAGDPSVGADTLSNGVLNAFLGDVLLQANQTITVGADVSLTNTPGQSLTLEAGGTIVVNAGVVLTVDGNVFFGTGGAGQSGAPPVAQLSPLISVLGTVQSNAGLVNLQAGTDGVITVGTAGVVGAATAATLTATAMNVAGTVIATNATLTATVGTLGLTGTVNASGSTTLTGEAGINGATGRIIGGGGLAAFSQSGAVILSNPNNAVFSAFGLAATSFTLNNSIDMLLGGIGAGTTATVTAPSILALGTITAPNVVLTANTGTLGLFTDSVIDATGSVILSGQTGIVGNAATVIGGGALTANSAAGAVDLTGSITVASATGGAATDFRLNNTTALDLGNVTAADTVIVSAPTLAVSGIVDAATANLTASTGTLSLTGTVDASVAASLSGQAGIAGATGRVIGEGALTADSPGGAIDLTNVNNAFSSATASAAGVVALFDTGGLNLGAVTAGTTVVATAGTLSASGPVTAPTVGLTATTGALTLTGVVEASSAVTLVGQTGIVGNAGTIIGGGTLSATSATGAVELTNAGNAIAAASGSAAGAFRLADTGGLNLGDVAAGSTASVSAESLLVAGLITAPTVSLTAGVGTLTLTGTVNASTAATLTGQAGVIGPTGLVIGGGSLDAKSATGAVDLTNGSNAVGTLSGSAAGTFAFVNGKAVTLGKVTSTGGNVFLRSTHLDGITFGAGGTVTSVAGGMVTLRADQVFNLGTVGATGVVDTGATGTFELAPNTQGANVSLGTSVFRTLSLESLVGITADRVRIGAYTAPTSPQGSSVTSAGSIAIGGAGFDMATGVVTPATLELLAAVGAGTGAVDQTAPLLSVGTLAGSAGSFALGHAGNEITAAPLLTASTGITIASSVALTLGTITTGNAAVISATTLSAPGIVTAADVSLTASTGPLTFAGTIDASRTVSLVGKAGIAGATGRLKGGHTLSATSAAGSIALGNTANEVADVSGSASGSFDFASFDTLNVGTITAGSAATLWATEMTVSGSIGAQAASLVATTGTLAVVGTVEATSSADLIGRFVTIPGKVIAPVATIDAAGGSLTLSGTLQATTANLSARDGIAGASGRVIGNTTLTAISVSGAVTLTNANNAIASAHGSASGAFAITSGIDLNLGTITAGTALMATAPTLTASGSLNAATVTLSATVGTLAITGLIDADTRAVLSGVAGIDGATGRIIGLGALTADSADGSVDLSNPANAVSSATGSAFGTFALVSGADLDLGNVSAGTEIIVSAPNITVLAVAAGSINAPEFQAESRFIEIQAAGDPVTVVAPTVSLTATTGTLAIEGIIDASADVFLSGQTGIDGAIGLITGGGSLHAGSVGGAVVLTNANNNVVFAEGSAAADFRLVDSVALTLGTVTAGPVAAIRAPTLTAEGVVSAGTVTLTATTGTLGITGTVNATAAAVLAGQAGIIGNAGTILGNGALTANSAGGAVELGNTANAVASVSGSALSDFTLVDTFALNIGIVTAGATASLTAQTATVSGAVSAQDVSITANTGSLAVTGTVDAGTGATLRGLTVSIANGGTVIAPTTSIAASAGALAIAGTVNASAQAELRGQSVSITGSVIASTASITALSGALEVAVGGLVNASTLADLRGPSVSIAGNVMAPTTSITAIIGALTVAGTVNATTRADLSGRSVSIAGEIIAPTTSITASLGALTVDGSVSASTQADLRGETVSIAGSVIAPTTSITATAGALHVGGLVNAITRASLRGQSVSIEGNVFSPTTSITATSGALDMDGKVEASTIAVLSGQTVSIGGSVIAPTTSITATSGALGITGAVTATNAAFLSGKTGIIGPSGTILGNGSLSAISTGGSVELTNTANLIASLEGSALGPFRVTNSAALAIPGGKSVTADTVLITALSLANAGTVTASGTGTSAEPALQLIATGGTVSNTGLVQATNASAGNLLVSATAGIESSGTITAAGPGLADAPSLALITTGGSVVQTAGLILASHEAGFLSVRAPGGAIAFAGTLMTGASTTTPTGAIDLAAGGDITETVVSAATGSLVTSLLTAAAGGSITLDGTAATGNRIVTLGVMNAVDNLIVANGRDLTIAGPVTAGGESIRIGAFTGEGPLSNLVIDGTVAASNGKIRLTADGSIEQNSGAMIVASSTGAVGDPAIEILAFGGTIGIAAGASILANSPTSGHVSLSSLSGITVAGTITAAGWAELAVLAGSIDINTGAVVEAIGAAAAVRPSVELIALAGTIGIASGAVVQASNAASGNVAIHAGFGITTAGTIIAAGSVAGTSSIAMTTGGVLAQTGGVIAATNAAGSAALNAGSIDIAGLLTIGSAGTLTMTAIGAISEGGGTGTIIAGRLTGSSGGTTTLDTLGNQIGALGPFSAGSGLTLLNSTEALTVSGSITVSGDNSSLYLRNGSSGGGNDLLLADDSRLQATNVTLLAPDRINGPDTTIVATALTLPNAGAAVTAANQIILGDPTSADPVPTNSIGSLGPIVANQSLVVMNATELLLGGDIAAPTIRIGATNGLAIANNVTITTGGTVLALPAQSAVPPDTDASIGFNLALLDSSGTIDLGPRLTIQGLPGVPEPIMRIAQTQAGQVRFGELVAPSTSVVLHVGTGSAVSQGGGNIDVRNLFVFYRTGAPSIELSGSVGGQTASGAATISRIAREAVTAAFGQTELGLIFDPSSVYQINQCSITSVNCVLTATLQIPPQLPLQTLYLPLPPSVLDDPDLLLPFISDQDD